MRPKQGKFAGLIKGDVIEVIEKFAKPYRARIDHFNSIGQPYVHPINTGISPKYLFGEDARKVTDDAKANGAS